jgi:thioredoxin reductase
VTDVLVVGGGPAGLACAVELRRRGAPDVVVLDRETRAGGIPRHCEHQGFGLRDLRRLLPGPSYAARYVELARSAGVRVVEGAMATGWSHGGGLEVTSPEGRDELAAAAIVLATGCRERPRAARLVPGSRPAGVLTTGQLQQHAQRGVEIGTRALVVGAEHVSFSAVLTLHEAGVRLAGMSTELPRHQTLGAFRAGAALRFRFPLWTRTAVTGIRGRTCVEAVELTDLARGAIRFVLCDTIVFTADWIPDHELAALCGIELDPGTRGPRVDTSLRTSAPGVFAAGNLLHGAEPADVAALSGRHAAASVARWLADQSWPPLPVPLVCRSPLHWISPNAVSADAVAPPRGRFALRSRAILRRPGIELRQDGRTLWRGRVARLVPGRSATLPAGWVASVDPRGGEVEIAVRD